MVTSDLRAEVEIWSFRACGMHPEGTVRSLWTCTMFPNYTMSIPIPVGFPWGKWDTAIPIPDADL